MVSVQLRQVNNGIIYGDWFKLDLLTLNIF